jgi:pimeloyl-ACP methyl ester carboxylesterase
VSYREELVAFDNSAAPGVRLAGTLTLPDGDGPFPAVLLIAGSGKNDRDETFGAGHKPLLVLADALTRRGYAVLRYDKRGVARSSGDAASATTFDSTSDARSAVAYLRRRPDIDGRRLGLIGHSEGGDIAAILGAEDPSLDYLVLLAGAAAPFKTVVAEQTRLAEIVSGKSPAAAAESYELNLRLFDAIAVAKDRADAEARIGQVAATTPQAAKADIDQAMHYARIPYMRYILAYDPTPALRQVRVPVMALNGSKDLIGPAALNLPGLRRALANDRDVTILEMPGLNHFFQRAGTGSSQEFSEIEETMAPEVLATIVPWVVKHTPAAHRASR